MAAKQAFLLLLEAVLETLRKQGTCQSHALTLEKEQSLRLFLLLAAVALAAAVFWSVLVEVAEKLAFLLQFEIILETL